MVIIVLKGLEDMGSRGDFSQSYGKTGGIPEGNRKYSSIGELGRISVLQCDYSSNNPTTTYSNTANTTYFAYSKERGRIEHIYYYKNHRLIKSVDFKNNEVPHTHYWGNGVTAGRKSHDNRNTFPLNDCDRRLYNLANDFNHGKKKLDKN